MFVHIANLFCTYIREFLDNIINAGYNKMHLNRCKNKKELKKYEKNISDYFNVVNVYVLLCELRI